MHYFERQDDGTYSNLMDAFNAVNCADGLVLSEAEIDANVAEAASLAPFFDPSFMYANLICTFWPVAPEMEPHQVTAKGAPSIMVVGTTGDPATPYAWSEQLTTELDSSFLVTFHGDQHVAIGAGSCVDDQYEQYLLNPDSPHVDEECSKDPIITGSSVSPGFRQRIHRW